MSGLIEEDALSGDGVGSGCEEVGLEASGSQQYVPLAKLLRQFVNLEVVFV